MSDTFIVHVSFLMIVFPYVLYSIFSVEQILKIRDLIYAIVNVIYKTTACTLIAANFA